VDFTYPAQFDIDKRLQDFRDGTKMSLSNLDSPGICTRTRLQSCGTTRIGIIPYMLCNPSIRPQTT
jgi:hypothetical protein